MKITLITTHKGELGIRYISSYAKAHGLSDINLIFGSLFEDRKYTRNQINGIKAVCSGSGLIGISSAAISENRTLQLLTELKKQPEPGFIVTGGITDILTPEFHLQNGADASNIHEGEQSFFDLATRLKKGENPYSTDNFWFRNDGQFIRNPIRPPIQNLDALPFPDYDFMNSEYYAMKGDSLQRILTEEQAFEDIPNLSSAGKGNLFVFTMRGCLYDCSYCCNSKLREISKSLGSSPIRKQSIEKVISDLEIITHENKYIQYISFFDDDFFVRTANENEEFSKEYRKRIGLPFFAYASPGTFTEQKLKLLLDAGLDRIGIGFQTGSKRMLELYNRSLSGIDKAVGITRIMSKYSDKMQVPDVDFLINSPFETEKDIIENINFIRRLHRPFDAQMHNLHISPGTRLHSVAKQNGIPVYNNLGDELQDHRHHAEEKLKNMHNGRDFYNLILYLMTGKHENDNMGVLNERELDLLMSFDENKRANLRGWFESKLKQLPIIRYYTEQEKKYKR